MYEKIYDFENLYIAFLKASKNKRYKKYILEFKNNLEENLINIQNHLIYNTYKPTQYKSFYVYDPKKRLIMAPNFKDRVVHHALCNVIEPIFEKRFIFDSYACRKGKGMHKASKRVQKFIVNNGYVLKADILKYFPSINQIILLEIIAKTIKCDRTLNLIKAIIESCDTGLPIGALTSQLFANVYLDQLDHFIKDEMGIKGYVRYMDDFVIIHQDKALLREFRKKIENFLITKLCLRLNRKTQIFPCLHGIDFCGYKIYKTYYKLRKRNIRRAKRKFRKFSKLYAQGKIDLKKVNASLMSFLGYANHSNNTKTIKSVVANLKLKSLP